MVIVSLQFDLYFSGSIRGDRHAAARVAGLAPTLHTQPVPRGLLVAGVQSSHLEEVGD